MSKLSPDELSRRLGGVKLLSLDVDGVLTDGGLYYGDDGHQLRKFNVKDGLGIKRAMGAGVQVAIVSAGKSKCVLKRAEDLGIKHVFIGAEDKLDTLEELCTKLQIGLDQVAHMGDDLNDIPVLEAVGVPLTVADAMDEAKELADYVTEKGGGQGAVREICDILVKSKN